MLPEQSSRGSSLLDRGQELGWPHIEAVGELDDDVKGRVAASALQSADVGAVEPDVVGEGLL